MEGDDNGEDGREKWWRWRLMVVAPNGGGLDETWRRAKGAVNAAVCLIVEYIAVIVMKAEQLRRCMV